MYVELLPSVQPSSQHIDINGKFEFVRSYRGI